MSEERSPDSGSPASPEGSAARGPTPREPAAGERAGADSPGGAGPPPEAGDGGPARPRRPSPWLGVVVALLVALAGAYVWKLVAVRDVRSEMGAARDSLHARSLRALDDRTADLLRLSVVPLGWAVRSEMLRRNYEQADAFMAELVGEPGVEGAVLAVPRDSILLATDRSLVGGRFSAHFPAELLQLTEPEVARDEDGAYRIAVPILGPTRSLGVLVVTYRPEEAELLPPQDDATRPAPASPAAEPAAPALRDSERGEPPRPPETAAVTTHMQEVAR